MNSPERQQLPSSILCLSLMFKLIAFSIYTNREFFEWKLDQRKAAKSGVPNAELERWLPCRIVCYEIMRGDCHTELFVLKSWDTDFHAALFVMKSWYPERWLPRRTVCDEILRGDCNAELFVMTSWQVTAMQNCSWWDREIQRGDMTATKNCSW